MCWVGPVDGWASRTSAGSMRPAGAGLTGSADAQPGNALTELLDDVVRRLESGDADEIKRGRDAVLSLLRERTITVPRRQEISDRLAPALSRLVADERDLVAINALRIAGELATGSAAEMLEKCLGERRTAVRYAAVTASGRIFEVMRESPPAIAPERAGRLVRRLGEVVAGDAVPEVMDAAVRALMAAMRLERAEHRGLAKQALATLGEQVSRRVRQMGKLADEAPLLPAILRACQAQRDLLLAVQAGVAEDPETVRQVVTLCGHALTYVMRTVDQLSGTGEDTWAAARGIAAVAETAFIAGARHLGGTFPAANLRDQLRPGNERAFFQAALAAINALHLPPFNLPANTFALRGGDGPR